MQCSIPGCERKALVRTLCKMHYKRLRRRELPSWKRRLERSDQERFWEKVHKTETCWLWTGGKTGSGYGIFGIQGRDWLAHRFAYQLLVGPIPTGFTLDHLCRIPLCVNPDHLESVTQQENTLRGIGPAAQNARKTHCPFNHPYDLLNTDFRARGGRRCRTCARLYARRRRAMSLPKILSG